MRPPRKQSSEVWQWQRVPVYSVELLAARVHARLRELGTTASAAAMKIDRSPTWWTLKVRGRSLCLTDLELMAKALHMTTDELVAHEPSWALGKDKTK